MNTLRTYLALSTFFIGSHLNAADAPFTSGSNGSYGPMNITTNTTLDLPPDGIFQCTTINIDQAATLRFNRNALNTPVYLLATGDVVIAGQIDISGGNPLKGEDSRSSGPGGFDGGLGGFSPVEPARGQAGFGPGGGKSGTHDTVGAGAYSIQATNNGEAGPKESDGKIYGNRSLIPIVGGSGGGGLDTTEGSQNFGRSGGGGGGAILIASTTLITVSGGIAATGGWSYDSFNTGSGGAVRLLAPKVYGSGNVSVDGGRLVNPNPQFNPGAGRIRIDSLFKFEFTNVLENLNIHFYPQSSVASVGSTMIVFPPTNPHLDVLAAAGHSVPEGTPARVTFALPMGTSTNQIVTIQARNFGTKVPIRVVLTPAAGDPLSFDAEIDNTTQNPAHTDVPVTVPVNTLVTINAWTR